MMKAADIRMNLTTQIFNIIKTIKLYVWEKVFLTKIKEKRAVELDYMSWLFWSSHVFLSSFIFCYYYFILF